MYIAVINLKQNISYLLIGYDINYSTGKHFFSGLICVQFLFCAIIIILQLKICIRLK